MEKTLFIVAGANGSGKTTFARKFCEKNNLEFINTDEIAKHCYSNIDAGKIFLKTVKERLNHSNSFVIETTLSGRYINSIINEAKLKGFKVEIIYIFLNSWVENIARVKQRVMKGGHDVPTQDIIRRYFRSKEIFWNIKNKVDNWSLIYNGEDDFILVADKNQVYLHTLYKLFLEDSGDE